jgi:hypothetical protein
MSVATQSSTTNRIDLAVGAGVLYAVNGSPVLTWRAKIFANAFQTVSTVSDCILATAINSGTAGLAFKLGRVGATSTAQIGAGGRASTADGYSMVYSDGVIQTNTWCDLVAVMNIPNDIVHFYINGRFDSSKTLAWTSTAVGMSGTNPTDRIGHRMNATDSASGLNGFIEELAMWRGDIGPNAIADLASGIDPSVIRPQDLAHYWPLRRVEDLRDVARPSRDTSGVALNTSGVVAGSVASGPSPPSVQSLRRMRVPQMLKVSSATFGAAWAGRQSLIGSGVY